MSSRNYIKLDEMVHLIYTEGMIEMKYIVILGDGMADEPVEALGNKTPLQVAHKPHMDSLAKGGKIGLVNTIPEGLSPGSDTANLSVMGYDPNKHYTGRSPLEVLSMGANMEDTDVSFRCNFVTLSDDSKPYKEKVILDHSADEITTEESNALLEYLVEYIGNSVLEFHTGTSYRHAIIWHDGSTDVNLTPPHDILEKKIGDYLPKGDNADKIEQMMTLSYELLRNHPINIKRKERGLNPANSIWIWGEGTKPTLPSFQDKYGLRGAMISAVDLLKGIAVVARMNNIQVEGATGNIHTNFKGKAKAAIEALQTNDFVYVHLEAPDECGHRGEMDNKIKSIELIDKEVVGYIKEKLDDLGEDYRIMVLPDHPTPIALRTHTSKPVPYLIYDSTQVQNNDQTYDEVSCEATYHRWQVGHTLMAYFLKKTPIEEEASC